MSLYGTKAQSEKKGPKPVWAYYALSVAALITALLGCIIYWPKSVPAFDELVMTGGEMRRLMIRDDLSDTGAGALLPIFTSAYMKFKDVDGEFRYPWTFPKYHRVRDNTAVYVDIWVEKTALGQDTPPLIWALKENNHHKEADEQTIILYEDVVEAQRKNGVTLIKFALAMAVLSIVFAFVGIGVSRWNRQKYPGYFP